MDFEKLTLQDLLKIEGFTDRCRLARRYPLTMLLVADVYENDFVINFVGKLPPILARDEEAYLECLAEIFAPGENKPAAEPAPAAKPAAKVGEQKPAAEPAPAVAKAAAKPDAKPAEGNRGAGRPPKAAAVSAGDIPDFDKLTNSELRDFCVKNSVISRVKKDMGNSKRESMIGWCKQHFGTPAAAPAEPAAEPKEAAAKPAEKAAEKPAVEPPSPYEGLSAKELFCICKERGLTVAERQPVDVYRDALSMDDMAREAREAKEQEVEAQKAAEPAEKEAVPDITAVPVPEADEKDDDFDDWDDADAEPAKEQEAAADDDDDDWDI